MEDRLGGASFRCLTGHPIPPERLGEESEIVTLDGGARVRICREHGCPIAVSLPPTDKMDAHV